MTNQIMFAGDRLSQSAVHRDKLTTMMSREPKEIPVGYLPMTDDKAGGEQIAFDRQIGIPENVIPMPLQFPQ